MFLKLKYKHLQIIKHALQHYIKRDGISPQDLQAEQSLLNKIECEVKGFKDHYIR